jgi:quinol monooxygenase YgiN
MIVLAVTWMSKEGEDAAIEAIFRNLQPASRREPGCLMFIVHRHRTDQRRFFIYEQYADDDALEAHRSSAHYQKYVVGELPKHGARVEGELYKPLDPA